MELQVCMEFMLMIKESNELASPIRFPRVHHFRVTDAMMQRLVIQEVKDILNGKRQGPASVCRTEDCLEQVVHKLLDCTLKRKQINQLERS